MKITTPSPSYISLFSSGGIGDLGFKLEDYECIASAELLSKRLEIQRLNDIAAPEDLICGDLLQNHLYDKIISRADQWQSINRQPVTLIIATPPCQGMSVANHKKKDELKRNSLVVRSIQAIDEITPLVFVFENVPAFIKTTCTGLDGVNRPIGDEIERVLGTRYEFYSQTLRLQEYGSPSSRKRSITIGVRNDVPWVTPLDLFPARQDAITLRELISDLPRLQEMGECMNGDVFHSFRPYNPRMRPWIAPLKEGQSAFENNDPELRPHRIVNGERVANVQKNADKYRRVPWDSTAPCVHTRNDILASQNTVHPVDDRVFSIRELMRMMGLPENFQWFAEQEQANRDSDTSALRRHATNIRQCLGEAIPVPITRAIASNVKQHLMAHMDISRQRPKRKPDSDWTTIPQRCAYRNMDTNTRKQFSSYYTQPLAAFAALKRTWTKFEKSRRSISVLEPSCGLGVFPAVLDSFPNSSKAIIDCYDIDSSLETELREISRELSNVTLNIYFKNFLRTNLEHTYDLAIGNPPFGRLPRDPRNPDEDNKEIATNFFIKTLKWAKNVCFVFPKALLHAHHYKALRDQINSNSDIEWIADFGELAFPNVSVETIGIGISANSQTEGASYVKIKSWPLEKNVTSEYQYICPKEAPTWIIYRDTNFDETWKSILTGKLYSWRDRKISRKYSVNNGVKVLRGKNINRDGKIVSTPQDYYVSPEIAAGTLTNLRNKKNQKLFLAPNLSYYPRAASFEIKDDAIPDGSCAVLYGQLSESEQNRFLQFVNSEEFQVFYRTACNFATRSINIDASLAYWWGVPTLD
ncbi:DNA cytosine methyltransferase [Corynebacterium accolens]|uniref:DNA cytosine methyltransferase n=1 Tax=Corynebacterium accolens TaxID=38284 RepID=UPI00254D9F0F|nr:DNA cytosine methyltransferase [Corynebacterium accolens]MDK8821268.1 DNA cytosine methyltransferase [Corynebacterium accolens]